MVLVRRCGYCLRFVFDALKIVVVGVKTPLLRKQESWARMGGSKLWIYFLPRSSKITYPSNRITHSINQLSKSRLPSASNLGGHWRSVSLLIEMALVVRPASEYCLRQPPDSNTLTWRIDRKPTTWDDPTLIQNVSVRFTGKRWDGQVGWPALTRYLSSGRLIKSWYSFTVVGESRATDAVTCFLF